MKLLFVINSFLAGGAERSLVELLPRFREQGITPVIACLGRSEVGFHDEVERGGFDVRFLEGKGRLGKIWSLRGLIKEIQPSLVYTSLFDADLAGRLAALGLDVPVMSLLANTAYDPARLDDPSINETKLKVVKAVDGFTARHFTDHFHAVSQAVKDSIVETLGVDPDKISVVYRGRDESRLGEPSAIRRKEVRARLGLDEDAEIVVTVGRQEYQKGHVHLVRAFKDVVSARPNARLLIVGREGSASGRIEALIDDLGLHDAVERLGHRVDVPDLLAASDVFVFPSVYEGLGGALIEALALALPAVVADLPALREVVEEGVNALVVPPAEAAPLAAALVELLSDADKRARFGAESRRLFDERFQAEDAAQKLFDLLVSFAGGS